MIGHPLKVSELLDEINRGDVLLPEIQRSYVWKGPQVAKLIDSLYREYPVGQILLWDTANLPITKTLRGAQSPHLPTAGNPKIVLDGQQRLTSLYLALAAEEDKINVYFNIEEESFQLYLKRLNSDPRWIPVREVINGDMDEFKILESIQEKGLLTLGDDLSKEYLKRIQKLKKIKDVKFPIEIYKSDEYEEVTELFVRINSGGTRLRMAELALAQLALRLPGAIVEKLESAIEEYEDSYFKLDSRFLTRALIAQGTGQSRFKHLTEFWKKPAEEIESIWEASHKGVNAAVNFVRNNALLESSNWLPSLNALIPLAAYMNNYPKIASDVESGLLKWFYLASLRGRYSGSGETAMDEDLKAVRSDNPLQELMKNLQSEGRSFIVTSDEFDDAGWRNPLFPMAYAAARKNRAVDWFTGIELSQHVIGESHKIQIHHVFPKARLKEVGTKRKDINEIANLAFLAAKPNRQISNKFPEEYLKEIADSHPERLQAQYIPMDEFLWKIDAYQDFLEARRILLAQAVNELIGFEQADNKKVG